MPPANHISLNCLFVKRIYKEFAIFICSNRDALQNVYPSQCIIMAFVADIP